MEKQYINNKEHILVCLSSAPSNPKIIQTAAAMAKAFNATFSALYVKTPDSEYMEAEDKNRLLANIHFAEKCGATICKDLKGIETGRVLCSCPECVRNAVLTLGEVLKLEEKV